MVGWWIVVSKQSPEERDRADQETRTLHILAQWEAGVGGLDWIDQLAAAGKARMLVGGGYPNRYAAKAEDVLPLIAEGGINPPAQGPTIIGIDEGEEYVQPPGWMGKIEVHADRVAACDGATIVTIEAWDQS